MPDFLSLGISASFADKLREQGIVTATPIQEHALPFVMEGRDVIAQAQTGTGKTLAFVLPILEKINRNVPYIQALIVTPTRELALQITAEVEKLIAGMEGLSVLAVYGGQDVDKQLKKLNKNVPIVVGTPGRLLDHIRRGTVQLSDVSFLVLDEADQMLHIGFLKDVEEIIRETPAARQTMLFSATMPAEIRNLARKHMNEPEFVQVEKKQGPADSVKQLAIHTTDRAKQGTLIELINTHRPFLAVIFCRTKRRVSKLYGILKANGFSCDELHGDLSQSKREQVMKRFREAEFQLLIATDVAARGLDVEGVTHVFNYDIPADAESYVHRIGRTGRAGMKGLAITLYSTDDRPILDGIEAVLNLRIDKQNNGQSNQEKKSQKNQGEQLPSGGQNRRRRSFSGQSNQTKKHRSGSNAPNDGQRPEREGQESRRNRGLKAGKLEAKAGATYNAGGKRPAKPKKTSSARGESRTNTRKPKGRNERSRRH
ncbi:DEAD/DEAH box helicase [Mesobacillus foraminis]|uniref:DEAD/DEAH box helicase n=1 Tax=Mesobacillus foraminis TaxID=279826 RepID=UPI000EF4FF92|nr:DEAD/DEAH box helicase [Mesobacillus foraminis]